MGQAAAAQCVNVALACAIAEELVRSKRIDVRNPLASNAVDPCMFASRECMEAHRGSEECLVGVVSTTQLVYNSKPTKLGVGCIRSAARKLAKLEIERQAISERVASANYMLLGICKSCSGGYEIDSVWASLVLVVYLCCDPRGRPLLREHTNLTDVDVQTACAFESYGRGEITRRARLRAAQHAEALKQLKKQKKKNSEASSSTAPMPLLSVGDGASDDEFDAETGILIEDDSSSIVNDYDEENVGDPMDAERADQKVLATKRKRASKGFASASTADAHGVLLW